MEETRAFLWTHDIPYCELDATNIDYSPYMNAVVVNKDIINKIDGGLTPNHSARHNSVISLFTANGNFEFVPFVYREEYAIFYLKTQAIYTFSGALGDDLSQQFAMEQRDRVRKKGFPITYHISKHYTRLEYKVFATIDGIGDLTERSIWSNDGYLPHRKFD